MSTTGEASKTTTNLETEQSCKVDSCGQMSKSQQSKGEVVGGKRGGGNRMLKSLSYALSKVLRHSAIRVSAMVGAKQDSLMVLGT